MESNNNKSNNVLSLEIDARRSLFTQKTKKKNIIVEESGIVWHVKVDVES